jgi:hypothetical protein
MEHTTTDQQAADAQRDEIAWTSVSNPRRVRI